MPTPARFPQGISTDPPHGIMGNCGLPDPFFWHVYSNHFDALNAADFTTTKVGTGTAALTANTGGAILLTTTAGASDSVLEQLVVASFAFTAGKKFIFRAKFQCSDPTNSTLHAGMLVTSATPLATATDGLYFRKSTGSTSILLRNNVGSVTTDLDLSSVGGVATAATDIVLGFYIDPKGVVSAYINDTTGFAVQNGPGGSRGPVASFTPTLTSSQVNVSFGITNGAAAAKTMTVDYIYAAQEA